MTTPQEEQNQSEAQAQGGETAQPQQSAPVEAAEAGSPSRTLSESAPSATEPQPLAAPPSVGGDAPAAGPVGSRLFALDLPTMAGVAVVLLLLGLDYLLLNARSAIVHKTGLVFMVALGLLPFFVVKRESVSAMGKLFDGVGDFFVSTLWAWGTLFVAWFLEVESPWIILGLVGLFFSLDAVFPKRRFLGCSAQDRFLISLARTLIGVTGVFMTFVSALAWVAALFGLNDKNTSLGGFLSYLLLASWSTWLTNKYFIAVGVRRPQGAPPVQESQEAPQQA